MAVTGHQRAIAQVVVDVLIAIHVVNAASAAVLHEQWIRRIVAVITGYSEGHSLDGFLMRLPRARRPAFVRFQLLFQCVVHLGVSFGQSPSLYSFGALVKLIRDEVREAAPRRIASKQTGSDEDRGPLSRGRNPRHR